MTKANSSRAEKTKRTQAPFHTSECFLFKLLSGQDEKDQSMCSHQLPLYKPQAVKTCSHRQPLEKWVFSLFVYFSHITSFPLFVNVLDISIFCIFLRQKFPIDTGVLSQNSQLWHFAMRQYQSYSLTQCK